MIRAQLVRARRLVADVEVKMALLVIAILADGIQQVDKFIVASDPAVAVLQTRRDKVDAVGGGKLQLALLKKRLAFVRIDELVVHGEAPALMRFVPGRLAKHKIVPRIVGDVIGTSRAVYLEKIQAAAPVRDLDADVVAVDRSGPVCHAVGVELAT